METKRVKVFIDNDLVLTFASEPGVSPLDGLGAAVESINRIGIKPPPRILNSHKIINTNVGFKKWFSMLKKMAVGSYGFTIYNSSSEAWIEYYENGFTPREAIDHDFYAGI